MFQKNKSKNLIIFAIIIPVVGIIFFAAATDSCGIKHIQIVDDVKKYEQTLDPEFCLDLVYQIDVFNEQCMPEIEILDCG